MNLDDFLDPKPDSSDRRVYYGWWRRHNRDKIKNWKKRKRNDVRIPKTPNATWKTNGEYHTQWRRNWRKTHPQENKKQTLKENHRRYDEYRSFLDSKSCVCCGSKKRMSFDHIVPIKNLTEYRSAMFQRAITATARFTIVILASGCTCQFLRT